MRNVSIVNCCLSNVSIVNCCITTASFQNIYLGANSLDTWVANKGYAPTASPTLSGTVTLPTSGNVIISSQSLDAWVAGKSYALSSALSSYAPTASPTLTGTVTLPSSGNIIISSQSLDAWVSSKSYALSSALSSYATTASPTLTGTVTLPSSGNIIISSQSLDAWVAGKSYALSSALSSYAPLASPTLTNPTLSGNITLSNTQASPGLNSLGYIQAINNNGLTTFAIPAGTAWYDIFALQVTYAGLYLVWFDFSFSYNSSPFLQFTISTLNNGIDDNHYYHTIGLNNSGYDFRCMMRYMYLTANQTIHALIRCTAGSASISLNGDTGVNIGGSGFYAVRIA